MPGDNADATALAAVAENIAAIAMQPALEDADATMAAAWRSLATFNAVIAVWPDLPERIRSRMALAAMIALTPPDPDEDARD